METLRSCPQVSLFFLGSQIVPLKDFRRQHFHIAYNLVELSLSPGLVSVTGRLFIVNLSSKSHNEQSYHTHFTDEETEFQRMYGFKIPQLVSVNSNPSLQDPSVYVHSSSPYGFSARDHIYSYFRKVRKVYIQGI